jgi:hypothetical protein
MEILVVDSMQATVLVHGMETMYQVPRLEKVASKNRSHVWIPSVFNKVSAVSRYKMDSSYAYHLDG